MTTKQGDSESQGMNIVEQENIIMVRAVPRQADKERGIKYNKRSDAAGKSQSNQDTGKQSDEGKLNKKFNKK